MMTTTLDYQAPRILREAIENGKWRSVSPDTLRGCLGGDLDDLRLLEGLQVMSLFSANLDHAGYVDHPAFCMTRKLEVSKDDPRLSFHRALFIGCSTIPGDDVFIAIQKEESEEYDPWVLVLDWREESPNRWTQRGRLSELIRGFQDDNEQVVHCIDLGNLTSPSVLSIEWGKVIVDGLGPFRDVKLYPGGGRAWDWSETDTHHVPGIQPSDVQELVDHGSDFVVLSRGMHLVLQTTHETTELLRKLSIPFVIEETRQAIATYNRLRMEGKRVGALIHSTC
jgi:hypothetical protein